MYLHQRKHLVQAARALEPEVQHLHPDQTRRPKCRKNTWKSRDMARDSESCHDDQKPRSDHCEHDDQRLQEFIIGGVHPVLSSWVPIAQGGCEGTWKLDYI